MIQNHSHGMMRKVNRSKIKFYLSKCQNFIKIMHFLLSNLIFYSEWLLYKWSSGDADWIIHNECAIITIDKPKSPSYTITELRAANNELWCAACCNRSSSNVRNTIGHLWTTNKHIWNATNSIDSRSYRK